jgi:tetratricopeptide (TPR) repeat protein
LHLGRPTEAYEEYERALAGAYETADLPAQAKSLHGLGDVCKTEGRSSEAIGWYEKAVTVRRRVGDLLGLARSLFEQGRQLAAVGKTAAAQQAWVEAAAVFDALQDPMAEEARRCIAEYLAEAQGDPSASE